MRKTMMLLLAMVGCFIFSGGNEVKAQHIYPLTPGTEEWDSQTNTAAKVKKLQLNELKESLSTHELLEVVLDYPYLSDLYLANSLSTAADQFAATFDGISELLVRDDLAKVLFEKYLVLQKQEPNSQAVLEQTFIEVLLAYRNLYEQLTVDQSAELFSALNKVSQSGRVMKSAFYDALPADNALRTASRFPGIPSSASTAAIDDRKDVTPTFHYALSPGTPEWNAESNTQAKVEKLQLGGIREKMPTSALLETVLEYPYLSDLYLANSMDTVIDDFARTFDGIEELIGRADLAENIIPIYLSLEANGDDPESTLKSAFLEVLLAHPDIYGQLNASDKEVFFDLLRDNKQSGRAFSDIFYNALPPGSSVWTEISTRTSEEAEPLPLGYYTTYIYTPKGTRVEALKITTELTPEEKLAIEESAKKISGAILQEGATSKYNCHAYAWPKIKDIWLDNWAIYTYDGSYIPASFAAPQVLISYQYNHSARYHSSTYGVKYISKWGQGPLMLHLPGAVPSIYGSPNTYWKNYLG